VAQNFDLKANFGDFFCRKERRKKRKKKRKEKRKRREGRRV
jgi:hypothetical protein